MQASTASCFAVAVPAMRWRFAARDCRVAPTVVYTAYGGKLSVSSIDPVLDIDFLAAAEVFSCDLGLLKAVGNREGLSGSPGVGPPQPVFCASEANSHSNRAHPAPPGGPIRQNMVAIDDFSVPMTSIRPGPDVS